MSNKLKVLQETGKVIDKDHLDIKKGQHSGRVLAYVHGTDQMLWEKAIPNKVIVPGSAFTDRKSTRLNSSHMT